MRVAVMSENTWSFRPIPSVVPHPHPKGGGGGGGTASLRVGTQNKTTDPSSVLPQPSLTVLAGLQPPVFEASKESLLLLLLLLRLAPSGHHFQLS